MMEMKKKAKWSRNNDHQEVATVPISQQRLPHTTVTTWWGNGDLGPLFIIFGENSFNQNVIKKLSKQYVG